MTLAAPDLLLMLNGLGLTALLTALGTVLAAVLAIPLAVALRSRHFWLVAPARAYVELMRGAPLVLLLFLLYYGGPAFGLRLSAPVAGVVGLGLFGAGGFAEIFRAGLGTIPQGEIEAARMLGIGRWHGFTRIELPQALRIVLPPSANQVITLVKESAVLSVITVAELTKAASQLATTSFSVVPYIVAALLYWALVELIARSGSAAERHFARSL